MSFIRCIQREQDLFDLNMDNTVDLKLIDHPNSNVNLITLTSNRHINEVILLGNCIFFTVEPEEIRNMRGRTRTHAMRSSNEDGIELKREKFYIYYIRLSDTCFSRPERILDYIRKPDGSALSYKCQYEYNF